MARRTTTPLFNLPTVRLEAVRNPEAIVLPVGPAATDEDTAAVVPHAYPLSDDLAEVLPLAVADFEHTGAAGSRSVLPRPGAKPSRVLLIGVGEGSEADLRAFGAAASRGMSDRRTAVIALPDDITPDGLRAAAESMLLAAYGFDLSSDAEPPTLRQIRLIPPAGIDAESEAALTAALETAVTVAKATCLARDLVNMPSDQKSPAWLAERAEAAVRDHAVQVEIAGPDQLAADGFAGLVAVGGGSPRGPRLVRLRWAPRGARQHVVLVGKGITFDSGGISLKPVSGMGLMKKDMAGAAAVLGTIVAAAELRLPIRITAFLPLAENMASGTAWRPGDVLRHYGGLTSEVHSTDAEGRVVMADVLAYAAKRLNPDVIIDLATLTGGQSVAVGKSTAALMAPSTPLADALYAAAETAGEQVWRLPLSEEYADTLSSETADLNNTSGNPQTVTAGLFLKRFVGTHADRWAHIDMSGPSWSGESSGELTKGATGWGVRTLIRWLETVATTPAES